MIRRAALLLPLAAGTATLGCSSGPPDEPAAFVEWVLGEVEKDVASHLDVFVELAVTGDEARPDDPRLDPLYDDLRKTLSPYVHPSFHFDWRWPQVRAGLLELVGWVAPDLVPFAMSYSTETVWLSEQEPPLRARVELSIHDHPSWGASTWSISLRRGEDGLWQCDREPRPARR